MIVNILTLTRYALPTDKLINIARNTFDKLPQFNISEIQNFIDGRLRAILLAEKPLLTTKEESQKKITKKNMLNAIFSTPQPMLRDVAPKIDALYNFIQREEANSLIEANKRVNNIFRKSDVRANNLQSPDESLFCEKEERELWAAITKFKNNNRTDIKEQEFSSLLQELLKIAQPVSAFFEHVMVNTDDERIRTNRFALLAELRKQLNQVADISKLSG